MTTRHRLPAGRGAGAVRLLPGLLGLALLAGGGVGLRAELRPDFRPAGALPAPLAPPATLAPPGPASPGAEPPTAESSSAGALPVPGPDPAGTPAAPTPTPTPAPASAAPTPVAAAPVVRALPDAGFAPDRLVVADLHVDAPVVPVRVDPHGALEIPEDAHEVGWWAQGGAPGSPVGTTVLAGHVDTYSQGAGALVRLADAPVGARVELHGPQGTAAYVVQARRRYDKRDLPWQELFAQTAAPRLVVVTCGGSFDERTRHYDDNVVVVAVPA